MENKNIIIYQDRTGRPEIQVCLHMHLLTLVEAFYLVVGVK